MVCRCDRSLNWSTCIQATSGSLSSNAGTATCPTHSAQSCSMLSLFPALADVISSGSPAGSGYLIKSQAERPAVLRCRPGLLTAVVWLPVAFLLVCKFTLWHLDLESNVCTILPFGLEDFMAASQFGITVASLT